MGACNKLVFFKLIELILTGACAGLHYYSLEDFEQLTMLAITAVVGGYVIVLIGALLATICGEPLPKRAWIVYCLAGIGLFVAVAVLAIQYQLESRVQGTINKVSDWIDKQTGNEQIIKENTKTYGLAKGAAAVANALTFFIDAICTFRYKPSE